jgi:Secretion system C-terminal sorting domain
MACKRYEETMIIVGRIIYCIFLLWGSCVFAQEQINSYSVPDYNPGDANDSAEYPGIKNVIMSDTLDLIGIYNPVANPCLTDPCLPGVVSAISCHDTVYIFTSGNSWFWNEFTWNDYAPFPGDSIRVTGTITKHQDLFGEWYWTIELIDVVPWQMTGLRSGEKNISGSPVLEQNYPNPFNPTTSIRYRLTVPGKVRLTIYDSSGEEVKCMVKTWQVAGEYIIEFNPTGLSSGTYFYQLQVGDFIQVKKMILLH